MTCHCSVVAVCDVVEIPLILLAMFHPVNFRGMPFITLGGHMDESVS